MAITTRIARALLAALVAVSLGAAFGAADAAAGAERVPLARGVNRGCFTGGQAGAATNGTAMINATGAGTILATVQLKDALPNTTYNVRLIQVPGGADCGTLDGTLTTNAQGNGTVTVREPRLAGTTGAFVVLNAVGFTAERDYYTTVNVTLGE